MSPKSVKSKKKKIDRGRERGRERGGEVNNATEKMKMTGACCDVTNQFYMIIDGYKYPYLMCMCGLHAYLGTIFN